MKHNPEVGDIWKYTDKESDDSEVFYLLVLQLESDIAKHHYLCVDLERDRKNIWSFHDYYYHMWEKLA
jgi:hypothetical protein